MANSALKHLQVGDPVIASGCLSISVPLDAGDDLGLVRLSVEADAVGPNIAAQASAPPRT